MGDRPRSHLRLTGDADSQWEISRMLKAGRCSQHNNKQDLGVNLGEADGWARAAAESGQLGTPPPAI